MNLEFSKLKCSTPPHIESYETLRRCELRAQTNCFRTDASERTDRILHYLHRSDARALLKLMYESKKPITLAEIVRGLGGSRGTAIAVSLIVEGEKLGLIKRTACALGTSNRKIAFGLTTQGRRLFNRCLKLCEIVELKYGS